MQTAKFSIGEVIYHKLFDYRGVIYDVDANFQGTEEWYQQVARSRPPKDRPWYKILVDGQIAETYVAEKNLKTIPNNKNTIDNPMVEQVFASFHNGSYVLRQTNN
jgi:heat shock protein HspQ